LDRGEAESGIMDGINIKRKMQMTESREFTIFYGFVVVLIEKLCKI
jgi:hypothetical protein